MLQKAGLDRKSQSSNAPQDNPTDPSTGSLQLAPTRAPPQKAKASRRFPVLADRRHPHAPGVWILYFSLAALPIFGVGQMLLPEKNDASRLIAFLLLAAYLASGLALLVTTSFLGLRRYLRQRRLQMPTRMAGTWIGLGTASITAILLAGVLLPRPDAAYSLTAMIGKIGSPSLDGSEFGLFEDGTETDGFSKRFRRNGSDANGRPLEGDESGLTATASGPGNDWFLSASRWSQSGSLGMTLANLLRWFLYALLIAALLWLIYRQRKPIMQALVEFWQAIRRWFVRWFGWCLPRFVFRSGTSAASRAEQSRDFATFRNPFASGAAQHWTAAQLIQYTYEAVQAWAKENHAGRRPQQTPFEFTCGLACALPGAADDLMQLGRLYSRLAYSHHAPDSVPTRGLEHLWTELRSPSGPSV